VFIAKEVVNDADGSHWWRWEVQLSFYEQGGNQIGIDWDNYFGSQMALSDLSLGVQGLLRGKAKYWWGDNQTGVFHFWNEQDHWNFPGFLEKWLRKYSIENMSDAEQDKK
jgi:hypothetical protein